NGGGRDSTIPVQVLGAGGTGYLRNVSTVAGGGSHSLAAKGDGTVWAWGLNDAGQLGDGTLTTRTTPVAVGGLPVTYFIAGGTSHSLALASDGTLWAWGRNDLGQLGDCTATN